MRCLVEPHRRIVYVIHTHQPQIVAIEDGIDILAELLVVHAGKPARTSAS